MGDLDRLRQAARMARDRDLAALAAVVDSRVGVERQIADLRRATGMEGDAALGFLLAGGGERLEAWRAAEIARLNVRLAAIHAEELRLRTVAGRAQARAEVLDRLGATPRRR